jgi:hypothetical protein
MACKPDLTDTIRVNAQSPARTSVDGMSVEQHKLSDQIAVDTYLRSQGAAASPRRGLRFNKLVPPGAV